MLYSDKAFEMYMGQHDAVTAAALEPARRRAVLLGELLDARDSRPVQSIVRRGRRLGLVAAAVAAGLAVLRG